MLKLASRRNKYIFVVNSCQVYFIWHFKMKFHFIQKMTQEAVHFKWNIFYFKLVKWNYLNLFSECPSYYRFAHFTFFTNKHLGPCTPLGSVINIFPVNYNFPIKIFPLIKKLGSQPPIYVKAIHCLCISSFWVVTIIVLHYSSF